jgi:hypothetical protein
MRVAARVLVLLMIPQQVYGTPRASTLSTTISGLGASIQQNAFTLLVPTFDCALAENDGAKRGQPVTTAGKCARPETAQSKPIRNPRQPTATAQDRMVRRGRRFESVRALQKRRTWIKARRGVAPDRPTDPHPNMRAGGTLAFYATRIPQRYRRPSRDSASCNGLCSCCLPGPRRCTTHSPRACRSSAIRRL